MPSIDRWPLLALAVTLVVFGVVNTTTETETFNLHRRLISHWPSWKDVDVDRYNADLSSVVIHEEELYEGEDDVLEAISGRGFWEDLVTIRYWGLSAWWNQVEYGGEKLSAVDMHLHSGLFKDIPRAFQDLLLETIPFPLPRFIASPFFNLILSAYGVAFQLFCARVQRGVFFAVYAPESTGITTNRFVRDQIRKLPHKFWGLASLPVVNWEKNEHRSLDLLRKYLALDEFVGIKLAHPHMRINLNDPQYYSIYGVAREYHKPVYIHTGTVFAPNSLANKEATHPDFLEQAIQLYPTVTFILGHFGNGAIFDGLDDPFDACFRLALTYSNVYFEVSAFGSPSNDPDGSKMFGVYRDAKQFDLIERIIYGSDGPQFPGFVPSYLELNIAAMQRAGYTAAEAQLVLGDNFRSVFAV